MVGPGHVTFSDQYGEGYGVGPGHVTFSDQ